MDIFQMKAMLFTIIDSVEGTMPSDNRLQSLREMTTAGEPEVALEILCSDLDDDGVAVTAATLALIREIGQAMGIDPDYWERLVVKEHL